MISSGHSCAQASLAKYLANRVRGKHKNLLFLLCYGLLGCTGLSKNDIKSKIEETKMPKLELVASSQAVNSPALVPEQSAFFDVALRNSGDSPVEVVDLDGNQQTPIFELYSDSGAVLAKADGDDLFSRFGADTGEPMPEKLAVRSLPAGKGLSSWVDLWSYMEPQKKGQYFFGARHKVSRDSAAFEESNRVPFEIVDAEVQSYDLAYEDSSQSASFLAWIAKPVPGELPKLLLRLSASGNQCTAQRSGNPLGPVRGRCFGWVAVTSRNQVQFIRHFRTRPEWKSESLELPLSEALPCPGFPDREHAIFLATGKNPSGQPVLLGMIVRDKPETPIPAVPKGQLPPPARPSGPMKKPVPWMTPLKAMPTRVACSFAASGGIAVLLVAESEEQSSVSLIVVNEGGNPEQEEKALYKTSNRILVVSKDNRTEGSASFVILESERRAFNHLVVKRVSGTGAVEVLHDFGVVDWPRRGGDGKPFEPSAELDFKLSLEGKPWLALTDSDGNLYGGALAISDSPVIAEQDLVNPVSLIKLLRKADSPVSVHVWNRFPQSVRTGLENEQVAAKRRQLLAVSLNQVLGGDSIYTEERFASVNLSQKTKDLLKQKPQGDELVYLNRKLLEDAFPQELIGCPRAVLAHVHKPEENMRFKFPHIADIRQNCSFSAFTTQGSLFHIGASGDPCH